MASLDEFLTGQHRTELVELLRRYEDYRAKFVGSVFTGSEVREHCPLIFLAKEVSEARVREGIDPDPLADPTHRPQDN